MKNISSQQTTERGIYTRIRKHKSAGFMKFTTRELVTIAVFGAFLGIIEMSFGSILKGLHIPFAGSTLCCIGLFFELNGRTFVPKFGSILFIGTIAMFLKLLSIGSIIIGPMFGIFCEALVIEITVLVIGKQKKSTYMIAGSFGVLWTLIHPFVTGLLFFGTELFAIWIKIVNSGAKLLGINQNAGIVIIFILIIIHLTMGACAGWISWDVSQKLQHRMGQNAV